MENKNNIVYVNFKSKFVLDKNSSFLQTCETELCEEDFEELLEAIVNPMCYFECDDDIQSLVDIYYQH